MNIKALMTAMALAAMFVIMCVSIMHQAYAIDTMEFVRSFQVIP